MPLSAAAAFILAMSFAGEAAAHDCKCRFAGQRYQQGEMICIAGKLARCGMYLNNSSWTFTAEVCPQARSAARTEFAAAPGAVASRRLRQAPLLD